MPPDPKLGSFFVTPWPTSWTLVDALDVLRLRARCSQAMFNFQILDIFDFPLAPPTRLSAHALIRVSKKDWRFIYLFLRMLKILQTTPKIRPHQESFEKNCMADNVLPDHTVLSGRRAVRRPLFSERP